MSYPKSPAELVARAVAAHEAGFATKQAQKDALTDLSRAYDMMRNAIQQRVIERRNARDPNGKLDADEEAIYWALPNTLNNWRSKHAAVVLKIFPEAAGGVAEIDKLVELRAKLNAAPVAPKAPTKTEREEKIRLSATGKVYATEFGKLAPELERDFERYIEGAFEKLTSRYGSDMVKLLGAYYSSRSKLPENVRADDIDTFRKVVQRFLTGDSLQGRTAPRLDRARLDKEAKSYAKQQIDQFVVKLTQKLGDLTDVRIRQVNAHGFECIIEGSLRGHRVSVNQSAKFVVNQHGTAFHQWPALIYVDGKFTTESAFKRLAAGA
ncbi:MAG TPA: hypothetical protein VFE72_07455 [Lysobacter sp.]|nr:hypothetical protein [Lysobacter sp.]